MSNKQNETYSEFLVDNPEMLEKHYKEGLLSNEEYNRLRNIYLDNSDIVMQGIQDVNASLQQHFSESLQQVADDEDPELFNESWQEPGLQRA